MLGVNKAIVVASYVYSSDYASKPVFKKEPQKKARSSGLKDPIGIFEGITKEDYPINT